MRYILATILISLLTGCAAVNHTLDIVSTCPGLRPYDPQLCRGENFQQLPNFVNEAIVRRKRGEVW
jgi:hypothetical protein